jgi:photosystem II stability/assembly factor-like uncharacterized protein
MKKCSFLTLFLLISVSLLYGQWFDISPGSTYGEYYDLHFISADTGLLTSKGKFYRTTDGGSTWSFSQSPSAQRGICHLQNISADLWYAVDGADMLKSVDGGISWTLVSQIAALPYLNLYGFIFPSDSVGYVVYDYPARCFKTLDAGASWLQIPNFPMIDVASLTRMAGFPTKLFTFIAPDTGFVSSSANFFSRTFDGGQTWDSVYISGPGVQGGPYYAQFQAIDGQNAYAITDTLYRSTDGGQSWTSIGNGLFADVFSFPDADTAFFATCDFIPNSTYTSWLKRIYGMGNNPAFVYQTVWNLCPIRMQFLNSRSGFAINRCSGGPLGCTTILSTHAPMVSQEEPLEPLADLQVWPQPGQDQVYIRLQNNLDLQSAAILDLNGRLIKMIDHLNGNQQAIDIHGLPAGIYLLEVQDNEGNAYRTKIVLE